MLRRSLRILVFVASILAVGLYALAAWQASQGQSSPIALEQTLLDQADRMNRHQPVYGEASAEDTSMPMPGLGYALASVPGDLVTEVWKLRILVLLTTLAVGILILFIVHSETESWTLACAAAGFTLLGLGLFGSPPGLARPEPLVVLLALLGFVAFRFTHGIWGALMGGTLLSIAVFVQVQAAWFLLGAWVCLALEDRRRLLAFAATVFLIVGGGYVSLSLLYGPWFNYAVWDSGVQAAQFSAAGLLHFTKDQVLGVLGVCTVVTALSYAMSTPPWLGKKGIWMCFGVAAAAGGLAATQTTLPDPNAVFATVVAASLVGALSLQRVVSHVSASFDDEGTKGESALLSVLLLQFFLLFSTASTAPWATDALTVLRLTR